MKINHQQKTVAEAFGMSQERYRELAADITETIINGMLEQQSIKVTEVMEKTITEVRKEHLNTTVEPSAYELQMVLMGYLFGRITSPEHVKSLEIAAMTKKFTDGI